MSKPIVIILHRYSKIMINDIEIGNHIRYSQISLLPIESTDEVILQLYHSVKQNVYN